MDGWMDGWMGTSILTYRSAFSERMYRETKSVLILLGYRWRYGIAIGIGIEIWGSIVGYPTVSY